MNGPPWRTVRRGKTGGVVNLVELGARYGIASDDCLRGSGLRSDDLGATDTWILPEQELAVIANLVRHLGDRPGLGVEAGQMVNLGNLGVFAFAVMSSATIAEAIDVAIRFVSLTNAYVELSLEPSDGTGTWLICEFRNLDDEIRPFVMERDMTVIGWLSSLLLHGARLPRVDLELDTTRADILRRVIAADLVSADAAQTALLIPREWLDHPVPHADESTFRACCAQCGELLERRQLGMRAHVWSRLHDGRNSASSLTALAAELHVDSRTLQRRLAREGTSFNALRTLSRRTRAIELLKHTQRGIGEIANELGYVDPAAFTRAFSRWFGVSPSRYRADRR